MGAIDTSVPWGEGVAVRVENVSKSYGLWALPRARLSYPLLNLMRRAVPAALGLHRGSAWPS